MNAALFILAVACIFMGGLLLHVAFRCNKLIDESRSFRGTIRTLSTENESLKEKNLRKHVAMNRLARKSRQRGRTIQTFERKIGILNAQHEADGNLNGAFAKQILELKELTGKQCATISGLEKQIEELERHDNCPFRRTAKNRISYCTKEDK